MKDFWMHCLECSHVWVAGFAEEFGFLVALESYGEECPECGGEVEIDNEYRKGDVA